MFFIMLFYHFILRDAVRKGFLCCCCPAVPILNNPLAAAGEGGVMIAWFPPPKFKLDLLSPKGDACCWFPGNWNNDCCCCCDGLLKWNEAFWGSFDPKAGAELEPNDGGAGALLAKLKADFDASWFAGAVFNPLNDWVGATVAVLLPKLNDGFALCCDPPKIDWPEEACAGGESALLPKENEDFGASAGVAVLDPKTGVLFFEKIELAVVFEGTTFDPKTAEGVVLKPPKTEDGDGVTVAVKFGIGVGLELNAKVPGAAVLFGVIPVKLLDEYEGGPKALVVLLEIVLLPNDGGAVLEEENLKKIR